MKLYKLCPKWRNCAATAQNLNYVVSRHPFCRWCRLRQANKHISLSKKNFLAMKKGGKFVSDNKFNYYVFHDFEMANTIIDLDKELYEKRPTYSEEKSK